MNKLGPFELNSIVTGDCGNCLCEIPDESVTAVLCDPPYGLAFMGKGWDSFKTNTEFQAWVTTWAAELLRACVPGAVGLFFGGTRTFHRLACGLEDAGWEVYDTLMWMYGCIDEETEVLTELGWERYHSTLDKNRVLCYNKDKDTFQWEEPNYVFVYEYADTAYRIQSDTTDQLVSRNHRCLVEREGNLLFQRAERLASEQEIRIPILEDVRGLLEALFLPQQHPVQPQSALQRMSEGTLEKATGQHAARESGWDGAVCLPVRDGILSGAKSCEKKQRELLLATMQRGTAGTGVGTVRTPRAQGLDRREQSVLSRENEWPEQSSVEGRGDILSQEGQLRPAQNQVRALPREVQGNGPQGRLRDGASSDSGAASRPLSEAVGGSTSQRPQTREQRQVQSDALCQQQPTQEVRGDGFTRTTLATVTPIHYNGIMWCPNVPSGAFVARRNGHVFITGNSGFPKSHNISKAIDKHGGKSIGWFGPWLRQWREREGITQKQIAALFPSKTGGLTGCVANWELGFNMPTVEQFNAIRDAFGLPFDSMEEAEREVIGRNKRPKGWFTAQDGHDITTPATEAAATWDGYGTALKPAYEPIILARKLRKGTYAETAVEHGAGALNIDGCRIAGVTRDPRKADGSLGGSSFHGYEYDGRPKEWNPRQGRWPANLILSHSEGCRRVGVKRVKGERLRQLHHQSDSGFVDSGQDYFTATHGDPDGLETVEAWECVEGCPVAMLDEQSGERKAGGKVRGTELSRTGQNGIYGMWDRVENQPHNDRGGASRFFYCAKASRRERNAGLEGFEGKWHQRYGTRGQGPLPQQTPQSGQMAANPHPTVKPIALTEYLARLIRLPEEYLDDAVLLVPFAGTGSEIIGAIKAGWRRWLGIEISEEYAEIARARIVYWQERIEADRQKRVQLKMMI